LFKLKEIFQPAHINCRITEDIISVTHQRQYPLMHHRVDSFQVVKITMKDQNIF